MRCGDHTQPRDPGRRLFHRERVCSRPNRRAAIRYAAELRFGNSTRAAGRVDYVVDREPSAVEDILGTKSIGSEFALLACSAPDGYQRSDLPGFPGRVDAGGD